MNREIEKNTIWILNKCEILPTMRRAIFRRKFPFEVGSTLVHCALYPRGQYSTQNRNPIRLKGKPPPFNTLLLGAFQLPEVLEMSFWRLNRGQFKDQLCQWKISPRQQRNKMISASPVKVPDGVRERHHSVGDEHELRLKFRVLARQSLPALAC